MAKKVITWEVSVTLEIPDEYVPDIIGRTQAPDWNWNQTPLTPAQTWGRIGLFMASERRVLHEIPGWFDIDPDLSHGLMAECETAWELREVRDA